VSEVQLEQNGGTKADLNYQKEIHLTAFNVNLTCKGKSKAIPLQAWTGPGGSRRLRLTDFKTLGT